jgi:hypothetical protein
MDLKRRVQDIYGKLKIQKNNLLKLHSNRLHNIVLLMGALAFAFTFVYFHNYPQEEIIAIERKRNIKTVKPTTKKPAIKLIPWIGKTPLLYLLVFYTKVL